MSMLAATLVAVMALVPRADGVAATGSGIPALELGVSPLMRYEVRLGEWRGEVAYQPAAVVSATNLGRDAVRFVSVDGRSPTVLIRNLGGGLFPDEIDGPVRRVPSERVFVEPGDSVFVELRLLRQAEAFRFRLLAENGATDRYVDFVSDTLWVVGVPEVGLLTESEAIEAVRRHFPGSEVLPRPARFGPVWAIPFQTDGIRRRGIVSASRGDLLEVADGRRTSR